MPGRKRLGRTVTSTIDSGKIAQRPWARAWRAQARGWSRLPRRTVWGPRPVRVEIPPSSRASLRLTGTSAMNGSEPHDAGTRAGDVMRDLEQGRERYGKRAWASAHEAACRASIAWPRWRGEDLERLAVSAYFMGRDADYLQLLERAHQAYLAADAWVRAARAAFWLGLRLLLRGEVGQRERLAGSGRAAARPAAGRLRRARVPGAAGRPATRRRGRLGRRPRQRCRGGSRRRALHGAGSGGRGSASAGPRARRARASRARPVVAGRGHGRCRRGRGFAADEPDWSIAV